MAQERMVTRESWIETKLTFWRFLHMNSAKGLLAAMSFSHEDIKKHFRVNRSGIVINDPDWVACELQLIPADLFRADILSLVTTHKLTQELVTALNNFFEEVKDAPDFIAVTEYNELDG